MQKFLPVLKVVLLASLAVLVAAVALNLMFGTVTSAARVLPPLIAGLFGYWLLSASNWATAPKCPSCATQQPVWRRPASFRQMLWGGWTCAQCGTEMDRHGHVVARDNGKHA